MKVQMETSWTNYFEEFEFEMRAFEFEVDEFEGAEFKILLKSWEFRP